MIASILQLAGAILLGYFIAFRTKDDTRRSVMPILPVQGRKMQKSRDAYIETYAYRIGFIFIIFGYLVQVADWDLAYFHEQDAFSRICMTLVLSTLITFVGKVLAEILGKRTYDRSEVFNSKSDVIPEGTVAAFNDNEPTN